MQEKTVQPQEAENAKPLEQQLAEAHAQVEQQRDAMLRALADAENARKRFQAEAANAQPLEEQPQELPLIDAEAVEVDDLDFDAFVQDEPDESRRSGGGQANRG